MKQNLYKGFSILLIFIVYATACKKSIDPLITTPPAIPPAGTSPHDTTLAAPVLPVVPYPVSPVPECDFAPNYGDSIIYPQPTNSGDYYVYPQNNQGLQGTYLSDRKSVV